MKRRLATVRLRWDGTSQARYAGLRLVCIKRGRSTLDCYYVLDDGRRYPGEVTL